MRIRKLGPSDVTFTITTAPDDTDHTVQFDDPRDAEEITRRLRDGDSLAWCEVTVTASWNGFLARDYLGGCSLTGQYTAEACAKEHGMKAEALERLNQAIADVFAKLEPLLQGQPA